MVNYYFTELHRWFPVTMEEVIKDMRDMGIKQLRIWRADRVPGDEELYEDGKYIGEINSGMSTEEIKHKLMTI